MSVILLPVGILLSAVAGLFFLAGYLWYHHAHRLHEETFFPEDAAGIWMLRHGVSAGFVAFAGFLFTFVFHLLATDMATESLSRPQRWLVGLPYLRVAVGLFLLALAMFIVAGCSYAVDAVRTRVEAVR